MINAQGAHEHYPLPFPGPISIPGFRYNSRMVGMLSGSRAQGESVFT